MKAILFGASGMIGKGVLLECIDDPRVTEILVIGRSSIQSSNTKVQEILHADFTDFSLIREQLTHYDACFFCLGVSAGGMSEAAYTMFQAKAPIHLKREG